MQEPNSEESPLRSLLAGFERARKLTVWTALVLLAGTSVSWFYSRDLYQILALPLTQALDDRGADPRLVMTGLTDSFILYFSIALMGGLLFAVPILSAQLYLIVARRIRTVSAVAIAAFVLASSALFAGGVAFCYVVLIPFAVSYLLDIAGQFEPAVTVREFLRFTTRLLVAMGLAAQLPLVSLVAARTGLVTAVTLWRWFPYSVVVAFILSAWITPPDVMSQLLVAGPLIVLYLVGVAVAALVGR